MADEILEPLESYNKIYKQQFNDNAKEYFEELVETSKIDVEANRKTIKELKAKQEEFKKKKRKKFWLNFLKVVLIVISVVLIVAAVMITTNSENTKLKVWMWIGAGLFVAITIFSIFFVLIPKTLKLQSELDILKQEIQELIDLSWKQMAPLNALYDWGIPALLIERTIPLFQMDKHFDNKKYYYMNKKYGLDASVDNNASTYYVQSGSILGNPFLLCKDFRMDMRMKTYEGSITIHWTTRVHTKNGTQTVHHTQTLRAYVHHEAPYYQYVTYLIYGNDAAPKLTFSRMPSKGSDLDGKDLKKFVKKGAHKLDEKQRKEMMDNDPNTNYTRFGNDEFEVLFGGTDRNNELEYRLLFTPLAQKNMLHLLKDGPFGDDFSMVKEHTLNYIQSMHSQSFNYNANPTLFMSNDHDAAKEFFIDYNNKYFKNFFFEMAPLMSIPIYQQHKSIEYIYGEDFDANLSTYEHEAMANRFNPNDLKHPAAATPNIYKTTYISKNNKTDRVLITANAFRAERRVTYVTKMGGDGRLHTIPVYWIEYIPVFKETEMSVEESEISRPNFNSGYAGKIRSIIEGLKAGRGDYRFERGLLATIIAGDMLVGNNISDVLNTTSKVEEVFDIDKTVRELEKELDEMDKNSQKEGVGVEDINTLSESEQKEVSEEDVDVSSEDSDNQEKSDESNN